MSSTIPAGFDGTQKFFQIGLKPLGFGDWIDVDENTLPAYLDEKDRLFAAHPEQVFAAEPGTEAAQAEVLDLLATHLPERFPKIYRREGNAIAIVPAARRADLADPATPPLRIAANLVQEDLCLMRNGDVGWRLAAASLSFPSSWALREKFGRPIHDIHAPVPGFAEATRNAELIARMFDNLRPDIAVIRWNFSFYGNDRLFHPDTADPAKPRFGNGERAESVFLRAERQTLRKLPESRDILFTIRIYVDPLTALEAHPERAAIANRLIEQLESLTSDQLDYKGMTLERHRIVARLSEIADRGS